jgi:hypothetical protein
MFVMPGYCGQHQGSLSLAAPGHECWQLVRFSKVLKRAAAGPCSPCSASDFALSPQMQRLSSLMWQSLDLGRPEGAASRFTAMSGSLSLLPFSGFGS